MFTGLVERIGAVKRVSRGAGLVLEFAFEPWNTPLSDGESIAVNGVCLTVARHSGDRKSTRLNSSHPTTSRMPSAA